VSGGAVSGAKGFVVVTEAVMMIKGVVDVKPIGDHNIDDYTVELRVKQGIRQKPYDFIREAT
jgi:hypothetical protein